MWASWESGIRRDAAERLARLIERCDADSRELNDLEMNRNIQRVQQASTGVPLLNPRSLHTHVPRPNVAEGLLVKSGRTRCGRN